MLLLQERRVKRVVGLVVELEDGAVVTQNLGDDSALPVNIAPATVQAVQIENTPDTAPKARRRGGRRKKQDQPVQKLQPGEAGAAETAFEANDQQGGESHAEKPNAKILVRIEECLGVFQYECKDGSIKPMVIYRSGLYSKGKKKGRRWYLALFMSKNGEWAYSFTKPWFAVERKMSDIRWFSHAAQAA